MIVHKYIIQSNTCQGARFRPGDWVERIATMFATFDRDQRLRFTTEVQPYYVNGKKCLLVDGKLRDSHPSWFEYILQFADDNDLCVETD